MISSTSQLTVMRYYVLPFNFLRENQFKRKEKITQYGRAVTVVWRHLLYYKTFCREVVWMRWQQKEFATNNSTVGTGKTKRNITRVVLRKI